MSLPFTLYLTYTPFNCEDLQWSQGFDWEGYEYEIRVQCSNKQCGNEHIACMMARNSSPNANNDEHHRVHYHKRCACGNRMWVHMTPLDEQPVRLPSTPPHPDDPLPLPPSLHYEVPVMLLKLSGCRPIHWAWNNETDYWRVKLSYRDGLETFEDFHEFQFPLDSTRYQYEANFTFTVRASHEFRPGHPGQI